MRHRKRFGSLSQKYLQSNIWLFRLHSQPNAALVIAPRLAGDHQTTLLYCFATQVSNWIAVAIETRLIPSCQVDEVW